MNENSVCRARRDGPSRKGLSSNTQASKDRTCVESLKWLHEDGAMTERDAEEEALHDLAHHLATTMELDLELVLGRRYGTGTVLSL